MKALTLHKPRNKIIQKNCEFGIDYGGKTELLFTHTTKPNSRKGETDMEKMNLKTARKRAGYPTQAEVAEILGISKTTLCSYETGKTSPKHCTARKMAELYGKSLDELDFSMGRCSVKPEQEA